jgi:hypothetical protein
MLLFVVIIVHVRLTLNNKKQKYFKIIEPAHVCMNACNACEV